MVTGSTHSAKSTVLPEHFLRTKPEAAFIDQSHAAILRRLKLFRRLITTRAENDYVAYQSGKSWLDGAPATGHQRFSV
jgi:hypothetical protein